MANHAFLKVLREGSLEMEHTVGMPISIDRHNPLLRRIISR